MCGQARWGKVTSTQAVSWAARGTLIKFRPLAIRALSPACMHCHPQSLRGLRHPAIDTGGCVLMEHDTAAPGSRAAALGQALLL